MGKRASVGSRLRIAMRKKNLKQVDILNLAKPYFTDNIKISKTDLSQYVNDKTEPRSDKLNILSLALNIQQQWLLGYGDPNIIPSLDDLKKKANKQQVHQLTWQDLGMPYGGKIPDDLKDYYKALAEQYVKNHPDKFKK